MNINFNQEKLSDFYIRTKNKFYADAAFYNVSEEELNTYLKPLDKFNVFSDNTTMSDIYLRFLLSLQNRQRMEHIIHLWPEERREQFAKVFCDYDPEEVHFIYRDDAESLYNDLYNSGLINSSEKKMAMDWCIGALQGADILWKYNIKSFREYCTSMGRLQLPYQWSRQIHCMGFALSCDFFKEIGIDLCKPDIHIRRKFKEEFSEELQKINSDRKLCAAFVQATEEIKQLHPEVNVYKFDKMIWMDCTKGNKYYLRQ